MTLIELKTIKEALRNQLNEYERISPGCIDCLNFDSNHVCIKFAAEPPPEWKKGPVECAHWEFDGIPF